MWSGVRDWGWFVGKWFVQLDKNGRVRFDVAHPLPNLSIYFSEGHCS
jgi:hypothetical protein